MNFSGLFVGFITWRMYQNVSKFSLLQLLYNGGYTNSRKNRNNSTRSPLSVADVIFQQSHAAKRLLA